MLDIIKNIYFQLVINYNIIITNQRYTNILCTYISQKETYLTVTKPILTNIDRSDRTIGYFQQQMPKKQLFCQLAATSSINNPLLKVRVLII